jgi:hypothetical protein
MMSPVVGLERAIDISPKLSTNGKLRINQVFGGGFENLGIPFLPSQWRRKKSTTR